jgi:hypothetical protein
MLRKHNSNDRAVKKTGAFKEGVRQRRAAASGDVWSTAGCSRLSVSSAAARVHRPAKDGDSAKSRKGLHQAGPQGGSYRKD